MEIHLKRTACGPECSLGTLYVDGRRQCYTLEDVDREVDGDPVESWKIAGCTAIPRGRYRVTRSLSARFGAVMPLLLDVPGFSGIRIHAGNTAADTAGCILVGNHQSDFRIDHSRIAYRVLDGRIAAALARGEIVTIEVS